MDVNGVVKPPTYKELAQVKASKASSLLSLCEGPTTNSKPVSVSL
jgi:hypothetical protein